MMEILKGGTKSVHISHLRILSEAAAPKTSVAKIAKKTDKIDRARQTGTGTDWAGTRKWVKIACAARPHLFGLLSVPRPDADFVGFRYNRCLVAHAVVPTVGSDPRKCEGP